MSRTLPRSLELLLAGVALGTALGGPFAYEALSTYRTLPIPNPLFLAPVVGLLVYWWSTDLREGLWLVGVVAAVAGLQMILVLSVPAFVLDASPAGRAAVYQTAIFNAITSLVLPLPFVVITVVAASLLDTETNVLDWMERGRPDVNLVAITLALVAISGVLSGVVGLNYASAAEQSRADVTIAGIDADGERVAVTVTVPNRLRASMAVESVVLDFRLDDSRNVRASRILDARVPPGATGRFVVEVDPGELSPSAYRGAASVHVEGIVRVSAFHDYDVDLRVEPYDR